jgi:two-component system, NarL family, nitrate/nitrite response regulator NarL
MKSKILVYLVTSNRLLREALARLLSKKDDFEVCGISPNLPEVPASHVTMGADVLVLDAITAQPSDYALIPEIAAQSPRLKIVLIDMEDDPETFLKCVRAGAMGYLLKDASALDVISGVRCVAQGQAVCPSQMCTPLFRTVARQWTSFPSARIKVELGLTRRQQQLVPLIAQGFTNKEIACHLNISEQTVKNHIHRMLRRVGASDRLQVIDLTRSLGMYP